MRFATRDLVVRYGPVGRPALNGVTMETDYPCVTCPELGDCGTNLCKAGRAAGLRLKAGEV